MLPLREQNYSWMEQAACAGYPEPDIWYPDTKELFSVETREAQLICESCPVKAECYRFGLSEPFGGIYGGVLLMGGKPAPQKLPPVPTDRGPSWHRPGPEAPSNPRTRRTTSQPKLIPQEEARPVVMQRAVTKKPVQPEVEANAPNPEPRVEEVEVVVEEVQVARMREEPAPAPSGFLRRLFRNFLPR
jgi:Transcription factor WhiB